MPPYLARMPDSTDTRIFPEQPDIGGLRSVDNAARFSLILYAAAVLLAAATELSGVGWPGTLSYAVAFVAAMSAIGFLNRFSTIRSGPWRYVFVGLGVLWILGALAKLQHWAMAGPLLLTAVAGLVAAYAIRTFGKPQRQLLDYLKLLWLLLFAAITIVRLLHWGPPGLEALQFVVPALLQVLVWLQWRKVRARHRRIYPVR